MSTVMVVLRIIHILTGVFWAGSVFFAAAMLIPAIRATGPAGGQVMGHLVAVRRMPVVLGIVGGLTILSGLLMFWHNVSISAGAFARSTAGITYGVGAVAAFVAIGAAGGILGPTTKAMAALGAAVQAGGRPPTAEQASTLARLQARVGFGVRLGAATLGVAVICMAIAQYL